jgi:hypothetical protein
MFVAQTTIPAEGTAENGCWCLCQPAIIFLNIYILAPGGSYDFSGIGPFDILSPFR